MRCVALERGRDVRCSAEEGLEDVTHTSRRAILYLHYGERRQCYASQGFHCSSQRTIHSIPAQPTLPKRTSQVQIDRHTFPAS